MNGQIDGQAYNFYQLPSKPNHSSQGKNNSTKSFLNVFLSVRQNLFFFCGAGEFWKQLPRDVKSDVRTLNFRSDV